ncbi:MAG TPA: invasion associated locus B family protein [Methylovirgula sp.]|nr:invasion associated locus B family protein [Methylovirgula sp.]
MIRASGLGLALALCLAGLSSAAWAQSDADSSTSTHRTHKSAKPKAPKSSKKDGSKKESAKKESAKRGHADKAEASDEEDAGKPVQIATFGDWGAFLAEGKEKTCYVLAEPKERVPDKLKRDPAYIFISSRPDENIHNEVSVTMGFEMKDGGDAEADVAGTTYDLVSKGPNAWIKNPAQEAQFISALKKNAKLVVKATSVKGHTTTDSYSLAGLSQALERANKECR